MGPRDHLFISIWGENLEITEQVSSKGTIQFFFLGEVEVAGLNTLQIKEKIFGLLKDKGYYKDPVIIVQIKEYRSKEVQITGAVNNPGAYYLDTNYTSLLKLISMAGGGSEDRGNIAYVWRGGINAVYNPESKQLPPTNEQGESCPEENVTTEDNGDIPDAFRGMERIEVNIHQLLDKGDLSEDLIIYPGDFVLVNSISTEITSENYVWVEGAVSSPQQILYQPGISALQAVIRAGGYNDIASPNRATITRTGEDGSLSTIKVRLKDIQKGRRPDVELRPGDRIYVPESFW